MGIATEDMRIMLAQVRRADQSDLRLLNRAMKQRMETLRGLRTEANRKGAVAGRQVQLSADMRPKYLAGRIGEIHEVDGDTVVVKIAPIGKFTRGLVRVSLAGVTLL